jgi:hypothetical protein
MCIERYSYLVQAEKTFRHLDVLTKVKLFSHHAEKQVSHQKRCPLPEKSSVTRKEVQIFLQRIKSKSATDISGVSFLQLFQWI